MKKLVTVAAAVAALAATAMPASAAQPPEGLIECVNNGVTAVKYVLQGTPQPQTCNPLG